MCGIAGIIGETGNAPSLEQRVRRMQDALLHRGPDDKGHFIDAENGAAFAHTRLSIIDLSTAGHQPMTSACGRFTIVFNGEIYNYKVLREEMLAGGAVFNTETDTEVVLQRFKLKGEECLEDLRGMFAFAIWDNQTRECFLARDPLGIKPLYYSSAKGALAFASEIRALLPAGLTAPEIDPIAVYGFLRTGSLPEPLTPLRNVHQLEAGCCALWKDGRLHIDRYWSLESHFSSGSCSNMNQAIEITRAALVDSLAHHFVSDVPVGIFLSGGIDSTALLALSRAAFDNHLSTFSIRVDDASLNEGDLAREISGHFRSDHSEMHLDSRRAGEWIGDFLSSMDLPSIDGFNTYCVSRFASEKGAKVVLSGLGGDELFGGYGSFSAIPRMLRASRTLGALRRPAAGVIGCAAAALGNHRLKRFAEFLGGEPTVNRAFLAMRGVFSHEEALRLIAISGRQVDREAATRTLSQTPDPAKLPPSVTDQVSVYETTRYMRNQLLRDSDVMSMAHGLELRVPLVDRALFETVASIPSRFRIQPGKRLFTSAVPEIPRWVFERPKRGFALPFASWLEEDWSHLTSDLPRNSGVDLSLWYRKWALVTMQQWHRNLGLGEPW